MRYYVVRMGENFEKAIEAHGDRPFTSVEDAKSWGQFNLQPGEKFWVANEDGGVLVIAVVPKHMGSA
jgi:hypothetical protein